MAGTIVHLAVALELDGIIEREPETYLGERAGEYQFDRFVAGNICPDGIMANKNYHRSMKLHTHLRDGIPDGTFQEKAHLSLFRERLKQFSQSNIQNTERDFSLYLGYLTHLLTDEKFILEIYGKVLARIREETGLTMQDKETFVLFGRDTDAVDFRLIDEYPGMEKAYQALQAVKPYEIAGLIAEEDLTSSRRWILQYFFEPPHVTQWSCAPEPPRFLPYETMRAFIPAAAEEICGKLADYLVL